MYTKAVTANDKQHDIWTRGLCDTGVALFLIAAELLEATAVGNKTKAWDVHFYY